MKSKDVNAFCEELKGASEEQLNDKLILLREEQFKLRLQYRTGQLQDTSGIRKIRRNIARVKQMMTVKKSETKS